MSKYIGSNFDDFLEEEGVLAEAEAIAVKRVLTFQLKELMKAQKLNKTQLARRMKTSRSALERLLDPDNPSVTLLTLERAARALGKNIRIELAHIIKKMGFTRKTAQTGAVTLIQRFGSTLSLIHMLFLDGVYTATP